MPRRLSCRKAGLGVRRERLATRPSAQWRHRNAAVSVSHISALFFFVDVVRAPQLFPQLTSPCMELSFFFVTAGLVSRGDVTVEDDIPASPSLPAERRERGILLCENATHTATRVLCHMETY